MISFLITIQHIPPEPNLPAEGDNLKPDLTGETETANENDETEVTA